MTKCEEKTHWKEIEGSFVKRAQLFFENLHDNFFDSIELSSNST
jgi:hypothetical protein